jgi:quinol-cytochrome oxidoreductase complex cytochrome b subunit
VSLGRLSLLVAAGGVLSGAFLAFHYAPTLEAARDATAHVETLALGRFLRSLHHWSGTFALVLAALHGARVFWRGEHKPPGRSLWVLGCGIFLVLLGFAYTGYLLAGDERALAGLRVMEGVAGSTPLLGDAIAAAIRGGDTISSATLARLYAMHAVVLPGALVLLVAAFLRRTPPAPMPRGAALSVLALLALAALLLPPALGPKPDLAAGTGDARPEWFFLWVNELLHVVPGRAFLVAGLLPAVLAGLAIALPFVARGAERDPRLRKTEIACAAGILLGIAALTASSLAREPEATAETASSPADTPSSAAEAAMEKFQCRRCHVIDGSEPKDDTGPPLDRAAKGDRPAFRELYTREYFRRKVGDPRKYWPPTETNPGTSMNYTPMRLKPTPDELAALERWFFGE